MSGDTFHPLKKVMEKTNRQIKVENKEIKLVNDSVTFFPVFLIKVGNRQELGGLIWSQKRLV